MGHNEDGDYHVEDIGGHGKMVRERMNGGFREF